MKPVRLSGGAERDLDDIAAYSVETFGPDIAALYLRDIDRALDRLAAFPEIGSLAVALRQQPRCLPCRQHHIYYIVEQDSVLVIRILHQAMDPQKWLE